MNDMVSNAGNKTKDSSEVIDVGNKLALLVGINEYVDPVISNLTCSVNDINGFYEILVDSNRGKYHKDNVNILSDANEEKPTRNNILSKLATMSRSVNPEDSILFYFSGHGHEKNDKPYLLSSNSYTNTIEETAIPMELIRKTMESSLARIKIIVLDSCHSGVIKGIKDSGIMTKEFLETFFPPPEGFILLTSCKLGEHSFEWAEKEHSVFSYYLLEGLRGNADKNKDGVITVSDAHRYTNENVRRWAFKKGLEQNPTLYTEIAGVIPLAYVGRTLEEVEPIDKSIIETIILRTRNTEGDPRALAERMCGHLLQSVEADEIQKSGSDYLFPFGTITPRWTGSMEEAENSVEIKFAYKKQDWSKIDEVINYFATRYYLSVISYGISKRFNVASLVKKCKKNSFEIISFKPEKEKESIVVDTEGWVETKTTFQNEKNSANMHIFSNGYFPDDFYSTLSPENIVEFLQDCLE